MPAASENRISQVIRRSGIYARRFLSPVFVGHKCPTYPKSRTTPPQGSAHVFCHATGRLKTIFAFSDGLFAANSPNCVRGLRHTPYQSGRIPLVPNHTQGVPPQGDARGLCYITGRLKPQLQLVGRAFMPDVFCCRCLSGINARPTRNPGQLRPKSAHTFSAMQQAV